MDRDQKIELYIKEAKKFFPNISFQSASSLFSGILDKPVSGHIEYNYSFITKKAFSNNNLISFAHYTNMISAMSIINSGNVRLYNLLKSDDSKELEYAIKTSTLNLTQKNILNLKRTHFTMSGVIHETQEDEDFNLWRLYGDSGRGVALIFELNRNIVKWQNILCSKVNYGNLNDESNNILNFLSFHDDFNKNYKLFENIPSIIPSLALLIKESRWSIENEFRIIARNEFCEFSLKNPKIISKNNNHIMNTLAHELNKSGDIVSYIEIPIKNNFYQYDKLKSFSEDEKQLLNIISPKLTLKEVIFGPNLNHDRLHESVSKLIDFIPEKLGYNIEYSFSKFK